MVGAYTPTTAEPDRWRFLPYAVALGTGVAAIAYALPWQTVAGAGLFRYPTGDLAENLLGHLAYQAHGQHWPWLVAPTLGPDITIAMTDSNPAVSVLAKAAAAIAGSRVDLMGVWLAWCLLLQPFGAVYAMRTLTGRAPASRLNEAASALLAGLLALLLPAYLFRVFHINLFGQFLLLVALGEAARLCRAGEAAALPRTLGLLLLAVLIHPYLFIFSAALLAAPGLHMLVHGRAGARAAIRGWALACLVCIAAFMLLNGIISSGGPGFGLYSTNLLAPVWPQLSGLFGPRLPLLDATGYQYEGFNYLGAGVLLLLGAAAWHAAASGRRSAREVWRDLGGLAIVLAALFALAVTPHVTIGPWGLPIDVVLLDHLLAPVRASGRAVWSVDYALLLTATGYLAQRLRPAIFLALAAAIIALQWIDTQPLRHRALAYLSGGEQVAPDVTLPDGTTRFGIVPLCATYSGKQDQYNLLAVRRGAALNGVRTATPPAPPACETALQRGLHTPLQAGETRLFLSEIIPLMQRMDLGQNAACTPVPPGLLCHRENSTSPR